MFAATSDAADDIEDCELISSVIAMALATKRSIERMMGGNCGKQQVRVGRNSAEVVNQLGLCRIG